jgi:beta-lactamase regulating signal transducer with metallopeptidase domain
MTGKALHDLTEVVGWVFLAYLGQGTLLLIMLALLLALPIQSTARFRYGVCCVTLVMLCFLPGILLAVQIVLASNQTSNILIPQALMIISSLQDANGLSVPPVGVNPQPDYLSATSLPVWSSIVIPLWVVGATFFLIRLAVAYIYLHRLIRLHTTTVPPLITRELRSLCSQISIRRPVSVRQSQHVAAPLMWGHYRPCIVLPTHMLLRFSIAEIKAILSHELAHIKRRDYLMNLFQHFAEAFLFFHPGIWWLSKRLRLEREYCCDDLVTTEFAQDRHTYVKALVKLPELSTYVLAATESELVARIRRLSAASTNRLTADSHVLFIIALAPLAFIGHVLDAPRAPFRAALSSGEHVRVTMIGGATLYDLYLLMDSGGLSHLPDASSFILEEVASDGTTKRVTILPDDRRSLSYAFVINSELHDFDLEAQTWFAELFSSTIKPLLEIFNEDALRQVSAVQDRVNGRTVSLILEPHRGRNRHLVPVSQYEITSSSLGSPDQAFLGTRLVYAFHAVAHGLGTLDELHRFLEDMEKTYGFTLDDLL